VTTTAWLQAGFVGTPELGVRRGANREIRWHGGSGWLVSDGLKGRGHRGRAASVDQDEALETAFRI
jgi:hypothetical protein